MSSQRSNQGPSRALSSIAAGLAAAVLTLSLSPQARAAATTWQVRDVTPPGATACYPHRLNNLGAYVASASFGGDVTASTGVVSGPDGADAHVISAFGGEATAPMRITDNGLIAGSASWPGDVRRHAFLWRPGQPQAVDLGVGDQATSYAEDVNRHGVVAGEMVAANQSDLFGFVGRGRLGPAKAEEFQHYHVSIADDGATTGFLVDQSTGRLVAFLADAAGAYTRLPDLGGGMVYGQAINRRHQIVGGGLRLDGSFVAFITDADGRNFREAGVPGSSSWAYGLNDPGSAVGVAFDADGLPGHAWLRSPAGKVTNLTRAVPLVGDAIDLAQDINNRGQVLAHSLNNRCLLLTPVTP